MPKADMRTLAASTAASLAAVGAGAAGLFLSGHATATWLRNPLAWVAGALIAAAIVALGRSPKLCQSIILATLAGLVATLFSAAQSGVHRWIDVGPLHINIAALALPAAIVCFARLGVARLFSLAAAGLIGAILLLQPDASQATAFAAAFAFLLVGSDASKLTRAAGIAVSAALAVAVWIRRNPLEPVAEVEGILQLLGQVSPALVVIAALGLAGSTLSPLLHASRADRVGSNAAWALTTYFAITALAPAVGAFPVPLVGLGMSFPFGFWLALALLCADPSGSSRNGRA
jgi:cell division protein FtsW (lipid II flippase)